MYCNNCGKNNPENSKFCQQCGISLKNSTQAHTAHKDNEDGVTKKSHSEDVDASTPPYPYVISIPKLIILSIATFGVYEIYWFYKHFKSFKAEKEWKITPWARALFAGLMSYSLFKQVSEAVKELDKRKGLEAGGLAIVFFILNTLWRLPDPYWWISIVTFLPLIPVQNTINYYWEKKLGNNLVRSKFGLWNYIWAIGGFIVVVLALYGTFGMDENGNDKLFTSNNAVNETSIDTNSWTAFTEPAGRFSVSFPTYPEHETDNTEGIPFDSYTSSESDRLAYLVGVVTYDDTVDVSVPQDNLNGALNGIVSSNSSNELISSTNTSHNGFPAKDFIIRQNDIALQGRLVMVGSTLYEVIATYYESDGLPSAYENFISSFQTLSDWE